MSKSGWIHGSTVDQETREVRYLSPSGFQLGDMTTEKGCLRKWWYSYVRGLKEPTTWQQQAGTNDHACAERYLETGERVFTPRVAKGIHMLPPPGSNLMIEHDMVPVIWECKAPHVGEHLETCKKKSGLAIAPLRAAGIPVVGRIDLMHDLGINYGAESPEHAVDPPGTVEVFDHKFTKDLRFALKGSDMVKNIQMVAYGEYVFRTTDAKYVRLSHGYYPTTGNAVKRTTLTTREPISRFWSEHVEPLARSIADAAKETDPDKVPPNLKACKAFGRMCMHAEYCSAAMDAGLNGNLQSHVGATAAQGLLNIIKKPTEKTNMPLIPGKGLLAHIKQPATDTAAREAELAKLKAEEDAAKKKLVPSNFGELLDTIEAFGKGFPHLGGEASKIYQIYKGYDYKGGSGVGGSGELGDAGVQIMEIEQFKDLIDELTEAYGPPTTVESTPVAGLLPDDAPDVGTPTPPPAVAEAKVETPAPKPPRKPRTPKAKPDPTPDVVPLSLKKAEELPIIRDEDPTADAQYVKQIESQPAPSPTNGQVNLFVDVAVEGTQCIDLAASLDALVEAIAKRFDLDDIRDAPKGSALEFGKWKVVVSAAMREAEVIAPGTYHINARGNDIYEEAVQALRQVVRRTGGVYVRGGR